MTIRMLILHATPLSANGRKVLAVAKHLGIACDVKLVDVYRGEGRTAAYRAINPSGKIPALVEGAFTLWESNAILQYLAEAHGDCALWSRDAAERADVARWLFWEASEWQPALVGVMAGLVAQRLGLVAEAPAAVPDWSDARFVRVAKLLDDHLAKRVYLARSDELSIADFAVAGMMTYARATSFPFDQYPSIARWYGRVAGLDAWRATAVDPWR
jgi:glutathione S-transferase